MKNWKTLAENRLANILEMACIAFFILVMSLVWGHIQGRSHEVIDLYLAACKGLEQGISSVLTACRSDIFSLF